MLTLLKFVKSDVTPKIHRLSFVSNDNIWDLTEPEY